MSRSCHEYVRREQVVLRVFAWIASGVVAVMACPLRAEGAGAEASCAMVHLVCLQGEDKPSVAVSGVCALNAYTVLTARHCIYAADDVKVLYPDGQSASVTQVQDFPEADVVVLTVDRAALSFLMPSAAGAVGVGDAIRLVRRTDAGDVAFNGGKVTGQDLYSDSGALQASARWDAAWTGSGVLDDNGDLLGIAVNGSRENGQEATVSLAQVSRLERKPREAVTWVSWSSGRGKAGREYSRLISEAGQKLAAGDYDGVFRWSSAALLVQEDNGSALELLQVATARLGNGNHLWHSFQAALAKWPNSKPLLVYAGHARGTEKDWKSAAEFFERARAARDGPVVSYWLGRATEATDRAKAIACYSQSLDMHPGFGAALDSLCRLARPEVPGDDGMIALVKQSDTAFQVVEPESMDHFVRTLVRAGHIAEAKRAVEKVRDVRPYSASRMMLMFPELGQP